ncbi:probable G-protein coupled receptor 160 isoform X3 [Mustela nigripes]|uniref:probable G-protein coupled receptor 160 isoform X3 n=1 Tax=Mustela nigripes TaxID=77151 RepID=UPI0028154287|nr:probable G-protein coupled receptor 160 isoform X3 [Mustela nigripes]
MAPAHPANTGAPWVGAGFSRPGTRKRSPLSGGQLPLSPSSIAFLPPASRRRPSGQPPAGGATGRALKGCPARTPALPGRSGPSGGGVPTESPGATLVTPLLLLGALGAEPGQRAELPPLSRRSPGAGRSRCLVPRPAPGTRSAIRSPAAPGGPRRWRQGRTPQFQRRPQGHSPRRKVPQAEDVQMTRDWNLFVVSAVWNYWELPIAISLAALRIAATGNLRFKHC